MSLGACGLALLKLKWPDLRVQLDTACKQSSNFRDEVAAYAKAVMYWERMVREAVQGANLKQYEILCDNLEVDIRRDLLFFTHGWRTG